MRTWWAGWGPLTRRRVVAEFVGLALAVGALVVLATGDVHRQRAAGSLLGAAFISVVVGVAAGLVRPTASVIDPPRSLLIFGALFLMGAIGAT